MKKIITLVLCVAVFTPVHAKQKNTAKLHKEQGASTHVAAANRGNATTDTLLMPASFMPGSPCYSSLGIYSTAAGDHLAGNNSYNDKEVLMRYALHDYNTLLPAAVDTVKALFGRKHIFGNGNLRAKIYACDTDGNPTALLGTSMVITVNKVDTAGGLTRFGFATPVTITSDSFFVAVDFSSLYATGDSVALLSTDSACATAKAGSAAWSRISDGNYFAFADTVNNWGNAYDVGIFPHLSATAGPVVPTGISNVAQNSFAATVYPVPATNKVTVAYTAQDNSSTVICLRDVTGKTIATCKMQTIMGSVYETSFAVSHLSRGLYFVELSSGNNKSLIKLSVQ